MRSRAQDPDPAAGVLNRPHIPAGAAQVLHGEGDQLVSLDYLRGLTMPTLWRWRLRFRCRS